MVLSDFKTNAMAEAIRLGLTDTISVTYAVLGNIGTGFMTARRMITISHTQPDLLPGSESNLWLDAGNSPLVLHKSTHYKDPNTPAYEPVIAYEDIWNDVA